MVKYYIKINCWRPAKINDDVLASEMKENPTQTILQLVEKQNQSD